MFAELIAHVRAGHALATEQVVQAVAVLADERVAPEPKADFLTALAQRGETTDEIAAFAHELRERATPVPLDAETRAREILDVCGTGGDRLNTFNISTTVALVCAAAGVTVAKHGNRAITSQSGSADVLAALGIPIEQTPAEVAAALRAHGFAFLFAAKFHPSFKAIGPARRLCAERGQRTLFNFLGPLLNPARPSVQLVGTSRRELVEPLARTLQSLGIRRGMVVAGEVPGHGVLDEFSTLGTNWIGEFYQDRAFHQSEWLAQELPLQPATLADLAGGNALDNAGIIRRLLAGEDRTPRLDAVLLNAAAALFVAGQAASIAAGWDLAEKTVLSGAATRKLADLAAPAP
ncbi:MAG TPA: anthranilate phosphoribosyltransferase [Candidatus Limnocylindria bacterium]|nr:anthranilate phosphoribosyltransferase [Candidatus Limnocylindria bacterium]